VLHGQHAGLAVVRRQEGAKGMPSPANSKQHSLNMLHDRSMLRTIGVATATRAPVD
jgi:hypothetical protein